MKRSLTKDTFREIRHSMGRFLSIFAIVALGCGFFAGLKATMPDMVDSANDYFEENYWEEEVEEFRRLRSPYLLYEE